MYNHYDHDDDNDYCNDYYDVLVPHESLGLANKRTPLRDRDIPESHDCHGRSSCHRCGPVFPASVRFARLPLRQKSGSEQPQEESIRLDLAKLPALRNEGCPVTPLSRP